MVISTEQKIHAEPKINVEQKMNQIEIDLRAMKEVLQRVSKLQVENTQTISELTFQVSELSRSVNTFVTHLSRSTGSREQANKPNSSKRNKRYISNKPEVSRAESKMVREQIDTMLDKLHTLMTYLEEPRHD